MMRRKISFFETTGTVKDASLHFRGNELSHKFSSLPNDEIADIELEILFNYNNEENNLSEGRLFFTVHTACGDTDSEELCNLVTLFETNNVDELPGKELKLIFVSEEANGCGCSNTLIAYSASGREDGYLIPSYLITRLKNLSGIISKEELINSFMVRELQSVL